MGAQFGFELVLSESIYRNHKVSYSDIYDRSGRRGSLRSSAIFIWRLCEHQ